MSREEGRRQTPKLESSSSVSVTHSRRPRLCEVLCHLSRSPEQLQTELRNRRAFVSFTNFTFTVWTPQAQWALQLLRDPRRAPEPSPFPKLPITDVFPIFRSVICLCGSAFLHAAGGSVSDSFPNNSVTKCFLFLHSSSILGP
ncbi:hypothetical protein FIBSPDRAFT_958544 [Athelia psychrophila]|uniref:Uncharacterized protein n=1 Tax=Athelia psychrophila TaxID=1759441 RepID=A0A166EEM3_9AGAM|nr:hypothetical protein FIBSPDRAFT_958544 [Fibularhizoctonia sp. CBS 109695]